MFLRAITSLACRSRFSARRAFRDGTAGVFAVLGVSAALLAASAHAQNLYWDLDGSTAGAGGGTTPFGLWTDTGTTWNLSATGNSVTIPWANNSIAVFSAGTNATGAYQVSLSGFANLSAAGLVFEEGDVTLNGLGTIQLTSPLPGIAPSLTLSNRPVVIGASVTLAGVAGLNIGGAGGTLTLQGKTTVLGPTTLNGADLVLGAADRLSDLSALVVGSGSTFDLANFDETIGGLGGAGKVTLGSGTLTVASVTDTTFSGGITGTGGLVKTGAARLTLTTPAAWTGGTAVYGGTLALGAANVFPDTAALALGSDGTFAVGTFTDRIGTLTGLGDVSLAGGTLELGTAGSFAFDGRFTGVGGVTKRGTGILSLAGRSTFAGTFNVATGTARALGYYVLPESAGLNVASGATFELGASTQLIDALTGAGQVTSSAQFSAVLGLGFNNGTFTTPTTVTGPAYLVKRGSGTMTLTGSFPDTPEISLEQGVLSLGATERINDAARVSLSIGATFGLGGFTETVGSIDNSGTIALGAGRLVLADNVNSENRGFITGTGGITKSGTGALTLFSPVSYTGQTRVFGGVLRTVGEQYLPAGAAVEIAAGAAVEVAGSTNPAVQDFGAVTGAGDLSTSVNFGNAVTLGRGNESFTFDGRLRGSGRFAKSGTGTLTLGGVSDFIAYFDLAGGTVRLATDEALPADPFDGLRLATGTRLELAGHAQTLGRFAAGTGGTIDLGAGGQLTLQALYTSVAYAFPGTVTGTGPLRKTGNETYTLSGPLTFSGPTRVAAGRLRLARSGTVDTDVTVDAGATLDLAGFTLAFDELTGAGTAEFGTGQLTVGAGGGDFSFGGSLAGDSGARFRKAGGGRFTLSGAGTVPAYFVDAGTFTVGANEVLPDAAVATLAAGTTFEVAGRTETIDRLLGTGAVTLGGGSLAVGAANASFVLETPVSGNGTFAKRGDGTLDLKAPLQNTLTAVQHGTLRLAAADRIADDATVQLDGAGTFDLAGYGEAIGALLGDGTVNVPAGSRFAIGGGDRSSTLSASLNGTGILRKIGAGNVVFSGKTTGALSVHLQCGRIALGGVDRFDAATPLTLDAGTTLLAPYATAQTFASLAGGGTIEIADGATVGVTSGYWSGALTGAGTFEKSGAGTFSLEGAQAFPGTLHVAAGKLRFFGLGPWSFGRMVADSGTSVECYAPVTLDGPLDHAGSWNGNNTRFNGPVTGTGFYWGDITFAGSLAPGDGFGVAHQTIVHGDVTLAPTNTLQLDLRGRARGTEYDALQADGVVTLGGTLRIDLRAGFVPVIGDFFRTCGTSVVAGTFAAYELPDLPLGRAWDPTRLAHDGKLYVVSDFEAWARGFGLDPAVDGAPLANPSGDGVANLLKFLFGGSPLLAQPELLPVARVETTGDGTTVLVFGYRSRDRAHNGLATVAVDWSTDLAAWTPAVPGQNGVEFSITTLTPTESFREYRIPIAGPRGFARLRAAL